MTQIPQLPMRPVLTLTEEELLVLTDDDLGVVPPRLQLPPEQSQVDLVRTVALRTLMARGFVQPIEHGASGDVGASAGEHVSPADGVAWEATEPLGVALEVRAVAPVVLALQRVLGPPVPAPGQPRPPDQPVDVRYLHLHPEVGVIEDVTEAAMHSLLTVLPDRYGDAVTDFICPPEAVAGTGGVRVLGGGRGAPEQSEGAVLALLADLGHPTVLVEAALLRHDLGGGVPSQSHLVLALGPGGCFRSDDSRRYYPIDPEQVGADLISWALPDLVAAA